MRFGKEFGSEVNINKKSMLFDHKRWCVQKQKNSTVSKILQRQNQRLLKENLALRKQNQQLTSFFKLKHQQDTLYSQQKPNLLETKQNLNEGLNTKTSFKSNQFGYQSNQKRYEPAKSARNYNQISARIQHRIFETEQRLNIRKSSASKGKRRFNYLGGGQVYNKTVQETQITKSQNETNNYFKNIELKQAQDCKVSFEQPKQQQIDFNIIKHKEQLSNQQQQRSEKLQEEIQQLRDIQSKLLNKIQQRDAIIQKLYSALNAQKVKNSSLIKETDSQTIDTAFSPKINP